MSERDTQMGVEHPAEMDERLAEEARRSFQAGYGQGIEQGRVQERDALTAIRKQVAQQLEQLATAFAQERDRYLQAVEKEVVKLSLAVAARILRRESQMDPLLLTGAVRVALGQLTTPTKATLRVPAAEAELWRESIALLPNIAAKPQVQSEPGMRLGECVLETGLGSADLGLRAQLNEIERGFFDRPGCSHPEGALELGNAGAGR
ncbi:hypothetical protein DYQ86_03765 [Acidobacteria bacterium AB60]|nr:hypothetical protein DYQ86_03765 [Acidobacteria bacterium AB60]